MNLSVELEKNKEDKIKYDFIKHIMTHFFAMIN